MGDIFKKTAGTAPQGPQRVRVQYEGSLPKSYTRKGGVTSYNYDSYTTFATEGSDGEFYDDGGHRLKNARKA